MPTLVRYSRPAPTMLFAGGESGTLPPPLDGLTMTGAWSMARDMVTSFEGNPRYTEAGGAVSVVFNQITVGDNDFSGEGGTLTTAGPNGVTAFSTNGVDQSFTFSGLSDLITASTGWIVATVIVDSGLVNDSEFYTNKQVFGEITGFMGLGFRDNGDPRQAFAGNWGAGNFSAQANGTITYGTIYVVEWRHEGGTVFVRVNGANEASQASGNTDGLSQIFWGRGYTGANTRLTGKHIEMFATNVIPAEAVRNTVIANMMQFAGAV